MRMSELPYEEQMYHYGLYADDKALMGEVSMPFDEWLAVEKQIEQEEQA